MKALSELYRIGHGPSSSHTMAPYRAAEIFKSRFPTASSFEVTLFGSLAATGKGHFTDTAIRSGLACPDTRLVWQSDVFLPEHPNAMLFKAFNSSAEQIGEWKVFSVGGGAISENGKSEDTPDIYVFENMSEILELCGKSGVPLWQIVSDAGEFDYLKSIKKQMFDTIESGLEKEGVLPGGLQLARRARNIYLKAKALRYDVRRTGLIAAYACASSEENASLGVVATAPTCGSCGVLPAVLRYLHETLRCSEQELIKALAVAGLVGSVIKQNASISGAEVGCQGEIGSACAMTSAAAAYLLGGTPGQCEYAAEMGLEHFLGLTCDPVAGLVQIPCIERNAAAANNALAAAEMALLSDGKHHVSFDDVVRTMLKTGKDMPSLYRETSLGGLAHTMRKSVQNT